MVSTLIFKRKVVGLNPDWAEKILDHCRMTEQ